LGDRTAQSTPTPTPSSDAVDQLMAELSLESSPFTFVEFDDVRRHLRGTQPLLEASLRLDFDLGA
jgi:hypothetical protein